MTTWEPASTFEWTWGEDRLRFDLVPDGEGTQLTFTIWLAAGDAVADNATGYHAWMDALAAFLDGAPMALHHDERLQQRYQGVLDTKTASPS